jgi:DNA (cytosine-5)-methyltransferase 1
MRKLTIGSLFSGIGGIDLGLERAGMETRWFSEIDPYASRVLAKHWPDVPNHGDITQIDFHAVEPVDVLCGGFPCQDISSAGGKVGIEGEKSGLWSEYARAVGELRPRYVFVENVATLLNRGIDRVLGDLAALGYDSEWHCVPAAYVGAPIGREGRDRVWLVAHPNDGGRGGPRLSRQAKWQLVGSIAGSRGTLARIPSAASDHWKNEPDVGRVADGVPARVDRLRGLGNAVVPQIPELIGGWIIEHARATGYLEDAA